MGAGSGGHTGAQEQKKESLDVVGRHTVKHLETSHHTHLCALISNEYNLVKPACLFFRNSLTPDLK